MVSNYPLTPMTPEWSDLFSLGSFPDSLAGLSALATSECLAGSPSSGAAERTARQKGKSYIPAAVGAPAPVSCRPDTFRPPGARRRRCSRPRRRKPPRTATRRRARPSPRALVEANHTRLLGHRFCQRRQRGRQLRPVGGERPARPAPRPWSFATRTAAPSTGRPTSVNGTVVRRPGLPQHRQLGHLGHLDPHRRAERRAQHDPGHRDDRQRQPQPRLLDVDAAGAPASRLPGRGRDDLAGRGGHQPHRLHRHRLCRLRQRRRRLRRVDGQRAAAGTASPDFRYANGTTAPRPMDISVNGDRAPGRPSPATGNWDTWADATVAVTLKAGVNTIRATGTDALGGPNVDRLAVSGSSGTDGQAPSVPPSPRVTGTSASSISLAWNDSTDNVAVTGYSVYEGTALKATPATASATVSGLATSSTHSYTVSAVDAAGNESGRSAAVTGTTSGAGGGVTADQLLAKVTACSQISNGRTRPTPMSAGRRWRCATRPARCSGRPTWTSTATAYVPPSATRTPTAASCRRPLLPDDGRRPAQRRAAALRGGAEPQQHLGLPQLQGDRLRHGGGDDLQRPDRVRRGR